MKLSRHIAPLVLVLAAAGCSLPQAAIPPSQTGDSAPLTTLAPSSTAPSASLAGIQACDLLTAQEATALGVPAHGETDSIAGLRRCDWTSLGGGGLSTAIDEQDGIDKLNLTDASSVTDITIGRHQAKRAVETSGPGYCNIFFAIGDTASVTVKALYRNDTARACAAADKAAAFVEPKLP